MSVVEGDVQTTSPRVLVIEDDEINLEIVERRLASKGFATLGATTGAAGLEAARTVVVDVVLLDLRLPDVDGLDILATLKQETPELPIVIMTAHGNDEVAEQARNAGAAAFLLKPVAYSVLTETVEGAARRKRG